MAFILCGEATMLVNGKTAYIKPLDAVDGLQSYRIRLGGAASMLQKKDGVWISDVLNDEHCSAIGAWIEQEDL